MDEDNKPVTPVKEDDQEEPVVPPTGTDTEVPEPKDEEEEDSQEIAKDPIEPKPEEEELPVSQPMSKRESKRVNQLLEKLREAEQPRTPAQPKQPSQREPIIPEGEYTQDEINQMAQAHADSLYKQGLNEAQAYNIANTFATRLEIDLPRVSGKYKFLDPESQEDFNPGLADFINRTYLNTVGYDPQTGVVQNQNVRYGEFVDGFMDVVELISSGRVVESTKNVAKQAAQAGIRPGGVAKQNYQGEDPSQMTTEQLNAKIAEGLGLAK